MFLYFLLRCPLHYTPAKFHYIPIAQHEVRQVAAAKMSNILLALQCKI